MDQRHSSVDVMTKTTTSEANALWQKLQGFQWLGLGPAMWAFVVSALMLPFFMYRTLSDHTGHEALRQARAVTLVASAVRSYYTTNVVGPVNRNKGSVTLSESYHKIDGGIPIPATLAIELGNAIREQAGTRDFEFRFISDLPFRHRSRPPLDEFQMSALRSFRQDAGATDSSDLEGDVVSGGYWRVEKAEGGSSMMRLAVPVRMEANCVSCHNAHPDSPVQNWAVGDVRGIQEVAVEFDLEGQAQDSREAMGALAWFIVVGFLALREHRSRVHALHLLNREMDESRRQLQENTAALAQTVRELQTQSTALDMAPFGIMVMHADNTGIRITHVNRAFCEVLGYELPEVQGRHPSFLFGNETIPSEAMSVLSALQNQQRAETELVTYTRDGMHRIMSWLVFPSFDVDGSLISMVTCLTDVTEIRQSEAERQQLASDLQESTKLESLGLAIAGIAHDLNTPIGVAVTSSSVVHKESEKLQEATKRVPTPVDELRHLAERIGKSAEMTLRNLARAAQLVKSFKETTADATRHQWRRVRLASVLESLMITMSPLMRRAQCQVVLNCPPDLDIYTEPGALSQALTNLMVNATIHAFEGVERRELVITVRTVGDHTVQIDVTDNGRGMTQEAAAKAFTPFFTTRHSSGGSGLGLFSCRRTIEQVLGGRITFQSVAGQGTAFCITLPLQTAPSPIETKEVNKQ